MRFIYRYIPLQLSLFLVVGILIGYQNIFQLDQLILIAIGLLLVVIAFYLLSNKYHAFNILFQISSYLFFLNLGILRSTQSTGLQDKQHYSYHLKDSNAVVLRIDKILKPGFYHDKYLVSMLQTDNEVTKGQILLNIQKDSTQNKLNIGDLYYAKVNFQTINKALNPYSFDYQKYMARQAIYHQVSIDPSEILPLKKSQNNLQTFMLHWREKVQSSLSKLNFQKDEWAVFSALILGQKNEISTSLRADYAAAGAVHLLAVSGLHIGILFLLFSYLFYPLNRFKNGNTIKQILIILLLWLFALFTGLSGSVVRAVSMFSFIALGQIIRPGRGNTLHALITSFFVLLIIQPLYLFQVGFQLSYLAVLGILLFYPLIYKLLPNSKYYLPRKIWQLFSLSMAATIGTFPLVIFYFHQFPVLFFISNIIIVPFLSIIMGTGLLLVVWQLSFGAPDWFVFFYNNILKGMNMLIRWVGNQESFLLRELWLSPVSVVIIYLTLLLAYFWIKEKNKFWLYATLGSIILLQFNLLGEKYQREKSSELVIFHQPRETMIGFQHANHIAIFHTLDSLKLSENKSLKNYKTNTQSAQLSFYDRIPNILRVFDKNILLIDSLGVYQIPDFKIDIVSLRQSPKINLERLLQDIHPSLLIADGSNYKSYVRRWEKTCLQHNQKFYYTGTSGAYIIKSYDEPESSDD